MTTHTPGPWRVEETKKGKLPQYSIWGGSNILVADTPWTAQDWLYNGNGSNAKANAHLIAAAPELLACLRACEAVLSHMPLIPGAEVAAARALLARVQGKEKSCA